MADPVQQAGGGEQIPAPTAQQAPAAPEVKTPTVETPITQVPAAGSSTVELPTTGPSTAGPPTAELPTGEPPTAEPPTIEPPKADVPTAELPSEKSPTAESSTAEPVKNEEPIVEALVVTPQAVSNNIEVLSTPVTEPVPELPPQEMENIKEKIAPVIIQEVQQNKKEGVGADTVDITPGSESTNKDENSNEAPKEAEDWQKRELELLKKIQELEKVKNARSEDGLRLELKVREEEIDLLKARVKNLETELQAALSKPGGKNHEMIEKIKQQHEELLSKARGMIFDKTKMVKNQELQIEALTTQVQSLKDINLITKDLLEIRNSEVKAMEERFQAMEARFKAEKERYDLVLKRAQTSTNINDDLRKEYETQLAIFKELREKYEQRVQALVAENNRLKEAVKGPGTSG